MYIPSSNTLPLISRDKSYEKLQKKRAFQNVRFTQTPREQDGQKLSYATNLEYLKGYAISVQEVHIASSAYRQYTIKF